MKKILYGSLVLAVAAGCYSGAINDTGTSGGTGDGTGSGSGDGTGSLDGGPGSASDSGSSQPTQGGDAAIDPNAPLWCQVKAHLIAECESCHGNPPTGGAPISLVTYADLTAASKLTSGKKIADDCLSRMQSLSAPMPPSPMPQPSASEISLWQQWIAAGYPNDPCTTMPDAGVPDASNPYNTPTVCTSNHTWNGSTTGSTMAPGRACIQCHQGNEGPSYSIAGTVYPTAHEPDGCWGIPGGAQVVITDANNVTHTLTVNSAGNFSYQGSIAKPYKAKVVANGKERAMSAAQTSGDCNTCHTLNGANSAPGRIMAP